MAEADYPLRARVLSSPVGRSLLGPWVSRRRLGLLIVLLSAAGIGAATPFARLAFDAGVDVVALMAIRYGAALWGVVLHLIWSRRRWRLHGRQLGGALGLALALGLLSLAFFASIRRIPVSMAALIYYTYPLLVSVLAYRAIRSAEQRRGHRLAFLGQAVSFGGLLFVLGLTWGSLDLRGVMLAATAALLIALVYLFGDQLMQSVPLMVLNLYVALVNAALFWGITALTNASARPFNLTGWFGLFGAVAFFVAGFMGMFAGVTLLGPSRAACLKNLEPVVTVGLSVLLLGESYGMLQFLGVGVVLTGIVAGCHSLWRSVKGTEVDGAARRTADLADCTPLCRLDSRCLLA